MSKLTEFRRNNPAVAALLRRILIMVLNGGTPQERLELLKEAEELDANNNGVPDHLETAAETEAPKRRGRAPKAKG